MCHGQIKLLFDFYNLMTSLFLTWTKFAHNCNKTSVYNLTVYDTSQLHVAVTYNNSHLFSSDNITLTYVSAVYILERRVNVRRTCLRCVELLVEVDRQGQQTAGVHSAEHKTHHACDDVA